MTRAKRDIGLWRAAMQEWGSVGDSINKDIAGLVLGDAPDAAMRIEEYLTKIKIASGKSFGEIMNYMNSSVLSFEDVYNFICISGAFPAPEDAKMIYKQKSLNGVQ